MRHRATRSRWRPVVLLLAVAGAASASACDRLSRSTAQGALDSRVARAIPAIEQQSGLKFKQRPRVELRTPAEVRAFLERAFNESRAARELAGQEQAYKLFGLVPEALDVRKILLDLLEEQVAGFYDPKTKTLYVVKGAASSDALRVTVAHELVHALQDQYVNLDSIQNADVDNDRSTAAQAAIEGHATYISLLNVVGEEGLKRLPGGWADVTSQVRAAALDAEGLGAAPPAIREGLIFPYTAGLTFASLMYPTHPGMGLLSNLPRSTEQVLHAQAYDPGRRDDPTTITLPAPEGAHRVYENTLGEFETRLFLGQHLRDTVTAAEAAAGWDGDRYMIVKTPQGTGIVWVTVWDTPADAARFRNALQQVTAKRFGAGAVAAMDGDGGALAGEADGSARSEPAPAPRRVTVQDRLIQGRSAVVYEELPAGSSGSPVRFDAVGIR